MNELTIHNILVKKIINNIFNEDTIDDVMLEISEHIGEEDARDLYMLAWSILNEDGAFDKHTAPPSNYIFPEEREEFCTQAELEELYKENMQAISEYYDKVC